MKCPHCGQEHPGNYQFCPVSGKKIDQKDVAISNLPHNISLSADRIFTNDNHIIRNGRVHCVDCDSTNIVRHNRNALQYTCQSCGLRFGNGGGENYDAKGNKISSYFKIYDIIVGITKKSEIDPESIEEYESDSSMSLVNGDFLLPNDGEYLCNKVVFSRGDYSYYSETNIPRFYRKLGVDFGSKIDDNYNKFAELGFSVTQFSSGNCCGPSLRVVLPWSNKYQAKLVLELEYDDFDDDGLRELSISVEH